MNKSSFKDLQVWQRSVELAKEIYNSLVKLPNHELFGLRGQMCRAAVSIASNIAEGQKRGTKKDFVQFLRMAYGSSAELETQIIIAESAYPTLDLAEAKRLLSEVQKMLPVLINRLSSAAN